jgi:glycosyltransferase involved in cell wall biosynthesis
MSVYNQSYKDWLLVMISDGSEDKTGENISKIVSDKVIVEVHNDNAGAAKRRYKAIHKYAEPEDVILLLGMDDELLPDCLQTIAEQYDMGMLMTYGNWTDENGEGLPITFDLDFDKETHNNRDYRAVQYRSTAPNTFKKKLFERISREDFISNNIWIKCTTESPTMFACLEMAGEKRIGVIEKPIYLYKRGKYNKTNRRFGRDYKYKLLEEIRSIKKYPLYEGN